MDIYENKKQKFKNKIMAPFLIGVVGGTSSGKTLVCKKIMEKLGQDLIDNKQKRVVCISEKSFYKVLNEEEKLAAKKGLYNFDHPNALDGVLMLNSLKSIISNEVVKLPVYDFITHSRKNDFITVYPADVILFEGILLFYFHEIKNLFDMKLFVDTDPDTRLSKRVLRDVKDRGRDLDIVLNHYIRYVKPAFEEFCQPTKKYADVIIPRGSDNEVAINLIMKYVEKYLDLCDKEKCTKIVFNEKPNSYKLNSNEKDNFKKSFLNDFCYQMVMQKEKLDSSKNDKSLIIIQ